MLEKLHKKYSLLYNVITDRSGSKWREFGSKDDVPYGGIIKNYTPGPEAMNPTF